MRALVVAIGNPLRGDDGAALEALKFVKLPAGVRTRTVQQLTPEIAAELNAVDWVIFVDADLEAKRVVIQQVGLRAPGSPLTHVTRPCEVVALARILFSFAGQAYLCGIPAGDLSEGATLSVSARRFAWHAAREIEALLAVQNGSTVAKAFPEQSHGNPQRRLTSV